MKKIVKVVLLMMLAFSVTMYGKELSSPITQIKEKSLPSSQSSTNWLKFLNENHESMISDSMRLHIFRLRPGDDLLNSIRMYVKQNNIQAGVILSAVGSLTQAAIRYANQHNAVISTGHFEIVSITGTVEKTGEHVHISIGTTQGNVIGGHLMPGCKIYTTAEIVIGEFKDVRFTRELDKKGSGWDELKIAPN